MTNYVQSMQEPGAPVVAKPDYTSYCDYLEARGWRREQLTLDELNTNIVQTFGVLVGATGVAIRVRAPAGQKISIMGTQQAPRGADARTAHALRIRLADTADAEIPLHTKLRLMKQKTSEAVVQLARVFYADVSLVRNPGAITAALTTVKPDTDWYRFKQGVEMNGEQRLDIIVVNTEMTAVNIDEHFVKFALDCDLWSREE